MIQVRVEQGWTSSLEVETTALIGDKVKKNKIKVALIIIIISFKVKRNKVKAILITISFAALFFLAALFIL